MDHHRQFTRPLLTRITDHGSAFIELLATRAEDHPDLAEHMLAALSDLEAALDLDCEGLPQPVTTK